MDNVLYQLHGFCDASNLVFACVGLIYLRRLAYGLSEVGLLLENLDWFQLLRTAGSFLARNWKPQNCVVR